MGLCNTKYDIKPFLKTFGVKLKKYNQLMEREGLDPQDTLRSIRARIIAKKNDLLLEALDITIQDQFPKHAKSILNDQTIKYEKYLPGAAQDVLTAGANDFTEMYDMSRNDKDIDNTTMEDSEGGTGDIQGSNQFDQKISDIGLHAFDDAYNRYTGLVHSKTELAKIYDDIKTYDSFFDFYTALNKKYDIPTREMLAVNMSEDEANLEVEIRERDLLSFYIMHQNENEMLRSDRYELVALNVDPSYMLKDYLLDMGKAVYSNPNASKLQHRLPYDLKNKTELSKYVPKNFIDESLHKIRGTTPISKATGYFNLSQSGKIIAYDKKYDENGNVTSMKWFFQQDSSSISEYELNKWEYTIATMESRRTGNPTPMVFVAPTPGDTGTFFMARILKSQANEMFPRDEVISALKELKMTGFASQIETLADGEPLWKWYAAKQSIYEYETYLAKTKSKEEGKTDLTLAEIKHGENWEARYNNIKQRFESLETTIQAIGLKNFEAYLRKQSPKYMTEEQVQMQLESANSVDARGKSQTAAGVPYNRVPIVHHISGMVARHEWLQGVRGSDYMLHENGNYFHLATRLKINKSLGVVPVGVGSSDRILYNQNHDKLRITYTNEMGEEVEINQVSDVAEEPWENAWDGASFYSTERLKLISDTVGSYPIRDGEFNPKQIKTVVSELQQDDKGNFLGYFENKHAAFEAKPGLKFYDGNKLIFETRLEEGNVRIYDANGKQYDSYHDLDATKTSSGIFDVSKKAFTSLTTQENSERVIITPHYHSNRTVYGHVAYLNSLNYEITNENERKSFERYTNTLLDLAKNQSNIYTDALLEASVNPEKMRNLLNHVYESLGNKQDDFAEKLRNTLGIGIHHPDFMLQAKAMLTNSLLAKGALQARTSTNKIAEGNDNALFGSTYIMAPDQINQVKDDKHVILSSENPAIVDRIKAIAATKDIKITNTEELNNFIAKYPQKVLTYRSPILHVNAVQARTIQMFVDGDANAVYHHPKDVFVRLVGDHDIDEAGVMLIPAKEAKVLEGFYETKWFEIMSSYNADYSMFETIKPYNVAKLSDAKEAWTDIAQGIGIQGAATNMKSSASTLSMRFNSIKFSDGVTVTPKKLNDTVIMDYAPLSSKFVKEYNKNKNLLPPGASIVFSEKDNNYYLKTKVAHEFLIIVNVATDYANKKTMGMIFNKWGHNGPNWFTDRIFNVSGGKLTKMHYKSLANLREMYNYSNLKKLRTDNAKRKMNFSYALKQLEDKRILLDLPLDLHMKKVINAMEVEYDSIGTGVQTKIALKPVSIEMNDVITAEEQIVIAPSVRLFEEYNENEAFPLVYPKERYEITHHLAKDNLKKNYIDANKFNIDELEQGIDIAEKYSKEFYQIPEEIKNKVNQVVRDDDTQMDIEDYVKQKKPQFDEKLFNLNAKYSKIIENLVEKYGEGVREVFTIHMIYGVDFRQNIAYLPALKHGNKYILSPKIHKEYMENWETLFFQTDETGTNLAYVQYKKYLKTWQTRRFPALEILTDRLTEQNRKNCI
tara:strand:+ start:2020 stop:6585 length:4566 start_codon:yes stop_codon:yes gene_type:complete